MLYIHIYIYIYVYIRSDKTFMSTRNHLLSEGSSSLNGKSTTRRVSKVAPAHVDTLQRGVQWIGGAVDWGVSYSKLVYNVIQITTPCFHCTPLCGM